MKKLILLLVAGLCAVALAQPMTATGLPVSQTGAVPGLLNQIRHAARPAKGGGTDGFKVMALIADGIPAALLQMIRDSSGGAITAVDAFSAQSFAFRRPDSLLAAGYSVILTWSNSTYLDSARFGDTLAKYMDLGGGVVMLVFANCGPWQIGGAFLRRYTPVAASTNINNTGTLGTVYVPGHPIMQGVTAIGNAQFAVPVSSILHPSYTTRVADWTNTYIQCAAFDSAGRRVVYLGYYPGYYTSMTGQWLRQMINALTWVNTAPAAFKVLYAGTEGDNAPLRAQIVAASGGQITSVDWVNAQSNDINPAVLWSQGYRVIIVYGGNYLWRGGKVYGDSLAFFVDRGGGVLTMTYTTCQGGDWCLQNSRYMLQYSSVPLVPYGGVSGQSMVALQPSHPIMAGVSSITGFTCEPYTTTLRASAYCVRIADWSASGYVQCAAFDSGGKRTAFLGYHPNYNVSGGGQWLTQLVNALIWMGNPNATTHDVGCTKIMTPLGFLDGTVDSGQVVTPACSVYNYGNQTETFYARMKIGGAYNYSTQVSGLAPATRAYVTFTTWTALPRGALAVSCSTELSGDMTPSNDKKTGTVTVNVHDVGATAIKAPSGPLDSGAVITPACSLYNYGTASEGYTARMKIGASYSTTASVSGHAAGAYVYVTFPTWIALPRGAVALSCSTELTTDMQRPNDKKTGAVTVNVHDVGCTKIGAPSGTIDSGTVVTPACSLYNYGTASEGYTARMKIGASYNNTASVSSHANGAYVYVTFPTWTALPRGTIALSCSTELTTDMQRPNDKTTGSVTVRVADAEVLGIIGPTDGNVDSGATVTPSATIRNNGTASATFNVRFDIGAWTSTKPITLAAGVSSPLSFDAWTATQRGTLASKCTTLLSGDLVPANDFKTGTVTVRVHDVAAEAIVAPTGTIGPGLITPEGKVHNYGTDREAVDVTFTINAVSPYTSTASLPNGLPLAQDTIIEFTSWTATTGSFTAKCSTYLTTDQIPANNVVSAAFAVGNVDVGVTTNLAPTGSNDTSAALTPSAKVKNFGDFASTFKTFFWMDNGLDAVVYNESLTVTTLSPTTESTVTFVEWPKPHAVGSYTSRCSTYLAGDGDHSNDARGGSFTVTATVPETGWVRKADLPLGPKSKRVKDGGALAYSNSSDGSDASDTSYIYAFKGNNRCEFYRYNATSNTWDTKESIPAIGRLGKKKAVKKGAAMTAAADDKLYAAKGNNCLEFWSYNPSYRSYSSYPWSQMADVPTGAKNVKEGAGMTCAVPGETAYIYFLKGSGTQEFYRYNPMPNLWETMSPAPLGASNKTWKNGSCLAYDGANTIYALKGSYNELFSYSCSTGIWDSHASLPLVGAGGKKKKVKDGAGLAYHAGHLYAQKGGNTFEFWTYAADSDRWAQYPDVPMGTGKKVKGGGALVYATGPNALYEFKGNNTLDFFKYGFSAISSQLTANRPNEMGNFQLSTFNLKLAVVPNPFSNATTISYSLPKPGDVSLKLYDVTGKLVSTLASGYHNAGTSSFIVSRSSLSSGIYMLKLVTENSSTTEKLIIE